MQAHRLIALSLISAAFAAGAAHAEGLTRADVRAETLAAAKAGQIPHGDLDLVSARPQAPGSQVDRATVKAELKAAIADGDVEVGDSGRTAREITPSRYPAEAATAGLTRSEVRQELAQAVRTGQLPRGDLDITDAEVSPQRYAAVAAGHSAM